MDVPPCSSRQPPDGDEFPDYHEVPIISKTTKSEISNKLPTSWGNTTLWKTSSTSPLFRDQQSSCSVRDKIAIFSNNNSEPIKITNLKKAYKSTDDILTTVEQERMEQDKTFLSSSTSVNKIKRSASSVCKSVADCVFPRKEKTNGSIDSNTFISGKARSSLDLSFETSHVRFPSDENYEDVREIPVSQPRLHKRSKSLLDVSSTDQNCRKDRWNLLAEQRQKSLSKLKGLVIPERVIEVDVPAVIDLPEIKSSDVISEITNDSLPVSLSTETPVLACHRDVQIPCLTTPPWSSNNENNIPKYSPAFKRKSLQVHTGTVKVDNSNNEGPCFKANLVSTVVEDSETRLSRLGQKQFSAKSISQSELYNTNQDSRISGSMCLSEAPKSLESITSPTRSDCSFEYTNSFSDVKINKQESSPRVCPANTRIGLYNLPKGKEDIGKSEDESDNDSAVSSSQSSYISRTSPPTSPSHLQSNFTSRTCSINESDSLVQLKCHSTGFQPHSQSGDNQNHRLLKPQSVEAINRKNILASAKCRSGRDLKIGSPLIQRKFEEPGGGNKSLINNANAVELNYSNEKHSQKCVTTYEKTSNVEVKSNSAITQSETPLKEEDSLILDNKVDYANNSDMQQIKQNNTEHAKLGVNENGLTSCVVSTVSTVHSETISVNKKNLKNDSSVIQETSTIDIRKERVGPVSTRFTKDVRSTSVTDLRKSFEKLTPTQTPTKLSNTLNVNKNNSPSAIKSSNHMQERPVSTTPPITEETQQVNLDNSNLGANIRKEDVEIIVLRPEIPGGSIGVTLAGGADYETKEITVYKIRNESSAHRDGRLQKGDTVISINGKNVEGLTHKQLVALLKEPLPQVTLVISRQKRASSSPDPIPSETNSSANSELLDTKDKIQTPTKQENLVVSLMKDAAGLGLSLEGGQDSPLGNMPLLIKKIFKGGAADKCGKLQVGDELVGVNEIDVSCMSRFEAWSVLKKSPEGITISLTIKR